MAQARKQTMEDDTPQNSTPLQDSATMLKVVPDKSTFAPDMSRATVVIESNNRNFAQAIETLQSMAARKLAISFATSKGMPYAAISGVNHPYPVNSEGLVLSDVRDEHGNTLPFTDPRMKPAAYRVDIVVMRGLAL